MARAQPKYWGSWEGKVVRVLIMHGKEPVSFDKLEGETGLHSGGLKRALAPLQQDHIIHYDGNGYLLVDEDIRNQWVEYLIEENSKAAKQLAEETRQLVKQSLKKENDLVQYIERWREMRNLSFPMESKHFFLEGEYLDELARVLISKAQSQILVTNPYINSCHLTKALKDIMERGIKVKVIARRPKDIREDSSKRKCQAELAKAGMTIHYDNQIHAKIIVIDDKVAIVSSMNLYSASSGGYTEEAGVVSFDEKVVDAVAKYILDLLEKPESTDSTY